MGAAPYTGADEDIFDAGGVLLLFVDAHTHLGMWRTASDLKGRMATRTPTRDPAPAR